jgi:hypothetical protein
MVELPSFNHAFELRVTLRHVEPAVWRTLVVPADIPLAALHEVLQAAFGWDNGHLHDFEVSGIRFAIVDDELEDEVLAVDEQAAPLGAVARQGSEFMYRYDFGDDWVHDVLVERMRPADPDALIVCTGGENACPPEGCGGPPGFAKLLKTGYLAPVFDIEAVNEQLAELTDELMGDLEPDEPAN